MGHVTSVIAINDVMLFRSFVGLKYFLSGFLN